MNSSEAYPQFVTEQISANDPITRGSVSFTVTLENGIIQNLEPQVGYLHKSLEKVCEAKTYDQLHLFSRMVDTDTPFISSMGCCMAVESLLEPEQLSVPVRTRYLRAIMAEFERANINLRFLARFCLQLGFELPVGRILSMAQGIHSLLQNAKGDSHLPLLCKLGGITEEIDQNWVNSALIYCSTSLPEIARIEHLITSNPVVREKTCGIGVLSRELITGYGITGANARASGVSFDLRTRYPFEPYDQFDFAPITEIEGDVFARIGVRIHEIEQSFDIIKLALSTMPRNLEEAVQSSYQEELDEQPEEDEVKEPVENQPKPIILEGLTYPKTSTYFRMEGARGEYSVFLVSDGTEKPYRIKFKTGSFATIAAISEIMSGEDYSNFGLILNSLDISMASVDR